MSWALLLLLGGTAFGQDLGAEAQFHFDLGVRAYTRGEHEEALEHLLLSNRLAANRKVVFNIARAYESLGQPRAAWSHYADFAAVEPDAAQRAPAEEAMERLAPQLALVRVETEPSGAAIFVDRRDLGQRGTSPRTVALDPGERMIEVLVDGYLPARGEVVAKKGQTGRLVLELEPELVPLTVDGHPEGAEIRRADTHELLGLVPAQFELPPGAWNLEISAPGHEDLQVDVVLSPAKAGQVRADLDPSMGTIAITGQVEGARVEVDGVPVGFVPAVLEMPVGPHEILVSSEGYRDARFQVVVHSDETTEVSARLVRWTEVVAASRVDEALLDAPSTVVVIDREDIRQRGYTDLAEVLPDLPGFDAIVANGVTYMLAYQRGYRTPQTQRTLLLTDGLEENLMWSQSAEISRQFPFSDISRIEVLYGPASAVYGPNALAGVVDVVTLDVDDLEAGQQEASVQVSGGSFGTGFVDGMARGRVGEVGYVVAGRWFASNEPDFSDRWGYSSAELLSDPAVWGPLLDDGVEGPFEVDGRSLGVYADPSENWGVRGRLLLGDLEVGASAWVVSEGYGPYYAADRAQTVPVWNTGSRRVWARLDTPISGRVESRSLLQHKQDRIDGTWAEASPVEGEVYQSLVSLTEWRAPASRWEARQQLLWEAAQGIQMLTGGRWVRSDLTREYDVPGYWDAFSSQAAQPQSANVPSTQESYPLPPAPAGDMPAVNRVAVDHLGGFAQLIADRGPVRLNTGARYDWNSGFGGELSPRASLIWRVSEDAAALKLTYGHAFQEPAARQLYGEWDGRGANPDLLPESVDHLELIAMARTTTALLEASVYGDQYRNVIQEESQNVGERQIVGGEVRARGSLPNPLRSTRPMNLWGHYTLTLTRGTRTWNPSAERWARVASPIGDVAPHKAAAGITAPMLGWAALHLRTNLVSARLPYSRNPLRTQGERFAAYGLFDAMAEVHGERWMLSLQIDNVLDSRVLQPGPESASAGNDFARRSLGYHNSALPLPGRAVMLSLTLDADSLSAR